MNPLSWRRPEVAIPAIYLAVAGAWTVGSEALVSAITGAPDVVEGWELLRDFLFVLVCGAALALGLRAVLGKLREEGRRRLEAEQRLSEELKQLAARLLDAREAEQARIGRDLHDDLGQLVTALTLTQRGVDRMARQLPPGAAATDLLARSGQARQLALEVLASIRRITADLRPVALQQLGLGAALEKEVKGLQGRSGMCCEVEVDPRVGVLPEQLALALYRIGQEALTNVARHAQANRVQLRLWEEGCEVWLRVGDDGQGFVPGAKQALGLLGMRERAAALGGQVEVRTGPGGGTQVLARIPLPARPVDEVAA